MQIRLTTTGRRSAQRRDVALYGWPDGERIVVVGSWGGSARDPAWVGNLRADPKARVRIGREEWDAIAREVEGAERDRLWALVCHAFPLYEAYQRRTERRIPLLVLERTGQSATVARP
jgi:deazaflavin-dependent oxidoreductase (nitroreductase family)